MPTTQSKLNITGDETEVEKYRFEPIKGYPMLHWRGKRPFESTQYYPAQIRESHGEPAPDGWMNQIFWGDNLQVMSHLLKKFRGQVKLIYIDPPYDSKADYKKTIQVKGSDINNNFTIFEEKQYTDIWTNDEYLQFMYERLLIMRELLSDEGTIYVQCDSHRMHYIKCIMDEIFGSQNEINLITWQRSHAHGDTGQGAKHFGRVCDYVLVFSKTQNFTFNAQYVPYTEEIINRDYKFKNDAGERYRLMPTDGPGGAKKGNPYYEFLGVTAYWRYSREKMQELYDKGEIFKSPNGRTLHRKRLLKDALGTPVTDLWNDVARISPTSNERLDYPTQKPEVLLERIIKTSSNPSDLIFDCFMGSGTTQAVSMKLGRRFIGADINLGAIHTTTKRLISLSSELRGQLDHEKYYIGFEVFNVNHYDVFSNPVQAKELLIEALEIQPLPGNQVWDGEKDGRFVKIMPVNRIATRADLNELIANLDYRTYEKRHHEAPNKAVEHITLVCMGHENDLAAVLKEQVPFRLDVEVVDILRDKSNLEFRRNAEADIQIEGGHLIIKAFYPMNLLQKLSLMKENVQDWRELTESVMIDFNYDGGVFAPQVTDIPDKKELVRGTYTVPAQAGTIRVKITDLLSESLEISIKA